MSNTDAQTPSEQSCENCKHWIDPTTNQGWKWCNRLRTYSPYFFHCQAYVTIQISKEQQHDKLV